MLTERKKDALMVTLYTYGALIFSFIYSSLFIRYDGGALYGIYAHAVTIMSFIVVALGFGFQVGLVKIDISETLYKKIATLVLIFSVLLVAATSVFYYLMFFEKSLDITFLLVLSAGCAALAEIVGAYWQWMKKIIAFKGWIVFRSLIYIVLVSLLVANIVDLKIFLILMTAFSMLHLIFLIVKSGVISGKEVLVNYQNNFTLLRSNLWSQSKFFWASLLAIAVYGKVGIVMLKFFSFSNQEIGRYAYLFSIMSAFLILPSAIQTYLLRPLFTKELDGAHILKKILPIYILAGTVCAFAFWKILPVLIKLIIGNSDDLTTIYWGFAPSILIVYVANLLGMSLMTGDREKERAVVQWISAGSHVLLNLILIPLYGLEGAALSVTGSYFILLLGFTAVSLYHNIWNSKRFIPVLIALPLISISFYLYDFSILIALGVSIFLFFKHYPARQV